MSLLSIPTFVGKTKLLASDLDSAFAAIKTVLEAVQADNFAAGLKFAPSQVAESYSLTQVSLTSTAVYKLRDLTMPEDSTVVGWCLTRTPAATAGEIKLLAKVGDFEHSWDDESGDLSIPHFAFDMRGVIGLSGRRLIIPKGQKLSLSLRMLHAGPFLLSASLQVLLKRLHTKG